MAAPAPPEPKVGLYVKDLDGFSGWMHRTLDDPAADFCFGARAGCAALSRAEALAFLAALPCRIVALPAGHAEYDWEQHAANARKDQKLRLKPLQVWAITLAFFHNNDDTLLRIGYAEGLGPYP